MHATILFLLLLAALPARADTMDTEPTTRHSPSIVVPEGVKLSPQSGGVSYTYRFELFPGTGGLTPDLALRYSSLRRNTEYGYGWSLGLGRIERCTRFGPPVYNDPASDGAGGGDRFALDGALLVSDPRNDGSSTTDSRFHERQNDFRRILYKAAGDYWEVTAPDGTRFLYGSRPGPANASRLTAGEDDTGTVFRWSLDRVVDPRGNAYEIDYEADTYEIEPGTSYVAQTYPKRVRYSFHETAGVSAEHGSRLVELLWEPRGADPLTTDQPTSYRAGFKIQTTQRLQAVRIGLDASGDGAVQDAELVRQYRLSYYPKTTTQTPLESPFSKLERIERDGVDPQTGAIEAFPTATVFEYSQPERAWEAGVLWPGSSGLTAVRHFSKDGDRTFSGLHDLNGDGIVDRIGVANGVWWVRYGLPDGGLDAVFPWEWHCPTPVTICSGESDELTNQWKNGSSWFVTADVADMNGDGLADRVISSESGNWTVRHNTGDGAFGPAQTWVLGPNSQLGTGPHLHISFHFKQTGPSNIPNFIGMSRIADVNGDGRPDHLTVGALPAGPVNRAWVSINNGAGFDPAVLQPFHNIAPSSEGVDRPAVWRGKEGDTYKILVDINGDGLPDQTPDHAAHDSQPYCSPFAFNRGGGRWQHDGGAGHENRAPNPEFCLAGETTSFDRTLAALLDVNGDGVVDIVNALGAQFGLGDGRFAEAVSWQPPWFGGSPFSPGWSIRWAPSPPPRDVLRELVDLDGDGLPEAVEADPGGAGWMVHPHPGPAGLLTKVTNELGGVTEIEYEASVSLAGQVPTSDSRPYTPEDHTGTQVGLSSRNHWLASRIVTRDGRASTPDADETTRYAEPRIDYARREYLGVRMSETSDAVGTTKRSIYHQSLERRGRAELSEMVASGGNLLSSTEVQWSATPARDETDVVIDDGAGNPVTWLVRPELEIRTLHDPSDPGKTQHRVVQRSYSPQTGNLEDEVDWGADALLDTGDEFARRTRYAPNFTDWLISYPSFRLEEFDPQNPSVVSYVETRYDGQTDPLDPPTAGLVTRRDTVRDFETGLVATEEWAYDAFGNQISYWDAREVAGGKAGITRETEWDPATQTFPALVRNRLGHEKAFAWDSGRGRVEQVRDANQHLRCFEHDAFGRLAARLDRTTPGTLGQACDRLLAEFDWIGLAPDPDGQHVAETLYRNPSASVRRRRFFDGLGRQYQTENERTTSGSDDFSIRVRGWDARGRLACRTRPLPSPGGSSLDCASSVPRLEFTYDELGRRTLMLESRGGHGGGQVFSEVNRTTSYAVDDLDGDGLDEHVETRVLPGQTTRIRRIGRDPAGRVVAVEESDGGLTLLRRDPKGRIILVDGPDVTLDGGAGTHPNWVSIRYDAVGQRTRLVRGDDLQDPASGPAWTYDWDLNGNLVKETFARLDAGGASVSAEYVWDPLDRLSYKDFAPFGATPGAEDVVYAYDSGTNGIGRLAAATAPQPLLPGQSLTTTYAYYLDGQLNTRTRDYGGGLVFPITYVNDFFGRPLITIYPDDTAVRHTWDGGVLDRIARGLFSDDSMIASGLAHHAGGGLESITFGDAGTVVSDYGYDPDTYRLATARTTVNAQAEQDLSFDWDGVGNLETVTDALGELSQVFSYDEVHRLLHAQRSGSQVVPGTESLGYGYDQAGNLRAHGDLTLLYGDWSAGPHAVTEVRVGADTRASYAYDDDGNVESWVKEDAGGADVSVAFTRDAEGRIHFTAESAWEKLAFHHYDHEGERARKQVSGTATADRLYVDREYEVDLVEGSHVIYAFAGDRRVAAVERDGVGTAADPGSTEALKFFHPDFVGSTTLVTEPSGWVQRVYPEPFGRIPAVREADGDLVPAAESATPYLFTDQEEDAEFGLQFFGARFYDPWIGRFLSPDPALLGPRPGASFADVAVEPQSLNAYAYALNRPTVRVDPTGAFIEEIVITGMRPAGPGFDPDSPPAFGPSDVFSPALGDLMATIGDGIVLGIAIGLVLHSSMEDGDDKDDSTDAPESDSAEPAEQVEPFAETFETFEQAVGEVEEDSITDIEQVKTKDPGVIAQGFTQKWIGTTRNGDPVSAFFNPTTGQFAGGGPSSRIP